MRNKDTDLKKQIKALESRAEQQEKQLIELQDDIADLQKNIEERPVPRIERRSPLMSLDEYLSSCLELDVGPWLPELALAPSKDYHKRWWMVTSDGDYRPCHNVNPGDNALAVYTRLDCEIDGHPVLKLAWVQGEDE